jgi:hypothetical protein
MKTALAVLHDSLGAKSFCVTDSALDVAPASVLGWAVESGSFNSLRLASQPVRGLAACIVG